MLSLFAASAAPEFSRVFQPTVMEDDIHNVASATAEFSRRWRDAEILADLSVGWNTRL